MPFCSRWVSHAACNPGLPSLSASTLSYGVPGYPKAWAPHGAMQRAQAGWDGPCLGTCTARTVALAEQLWLCCTSLPRGSQSTAKLQKGHCSTGSFMLPSPHRPLVSLPTTCPLGCLMLSTSWWCPQRAHLLPAQGEAHELRLWLREGNHCL